ncbi:MAG: sigma 54-interacting transcriptional regulator [Pseudomonadales bacterium]|nr:sigma 54-interacting transcriptional regulator [Pseudomonadales bacterium]
MANMLDGYEHPAILVTVDYKILATNDLYAERFGEINPKKTNYCYQVSHGYTKPCDQAGEDCPLMAAKSSRRKERVLHIHQTPRGKEHVDVELLPITENGEVKFFVELLKPVQIASAEDSNQNWVGNSPAFNRAIALITRVGPSDAAVLLLGPSGSGKELAAHAIHNASLRKDNAMVTLECAGLTESLFESELFGYVKGAFTGAIHDRPGLAEAANGGTLFLDEIGDIPYPLQVKLLRLLETGTYRPVGSTESKTTLFRLICATHKNIEELVEKDLFRQDLYYRINVFPIHIPALQERIEDIPIIAKTLLKRITPNTDFILTNTAMNQLKQHHYRGNVRELRNILTRATVLANTNVIDNHVLEQCFNISETPENEEPNLKELELRYLEKLMQRYKDDKEKVAEIAGISVRSLYRKLSD